MAYSWGKGNVVVIAMKMRSGRSLVWFCCEKPSLIPVLFDPIRIAVSCQPLKQLNALHLGFGIYLGEKGVVLNWMQYFLL
jgi:hypothetical protein